MPARRDVLALLLASGAAGCTALSGGSGVDDAGPVTTVDPDPNFRLTSPAFADGESIPQTYTFDGDDVSPPLSIEGVPDDARSLALVVDDPDAPDGTFVHWLVWNLPADTERIPEGVRQARRIPDLGARQGTNGFGELGYRGPRPPEGDEPHRYRFTLYALEEAVNVQAGARRRALDEAMRGLVVSSARLTGTYQRP